MPLEMSAERLKGQAAIVLTVVTIIAVAGLAVYSGRIIGGPTTTPSSTSSKPPSTQAFSITNPQNGSEASVYGFGSGSLLVQGISDLGPANWLYDPPHTVDLVKPSGTQCITDHSLSAPYMSIISATVFERAAQVAPTYVLQQLGVTMYMSNFTSLPESASLPGVSSLGWFLHFDFGNRSYYAGLYYVANSSTQSTQQPGGAPTRISYWYGPWKDNRPAGETQTNGSVTATPGAMIVYLPSEAIGNVTKGDALTNMGLVTVTGSGTTPDSGFYCTDDSFGGNVSYRLFDPLLPDGTIQVAATPSCPSSTSTASLNWTSDAWIPDQNDPYVWSANVQTAGRGTFRIYAQELQNGSVIQGPISVNANITYWVYATYTESQFPSACSTT